MPLRARLDRLSAAPVVGAIAARACAVAATFLMAVHVTQALSPGDAGTFFTLMALTVAGSTIGRFGTDTAVLKEAATRRIDRDDYRFLLRICALRAGLIAAAAPAISLLLFTHMSPSEHRGLLYVPLAVATMAGSLAVFFGSFLRGMGGVSRGILVETGIAPIVTVCLLAVVPGVDDLLAVLVAYASGHAFSALLGWAWSRRHQLGGPGSALIRGQGAERARGAMMATATLFYLLTWAPVITLGYLGFVTEAAYYTAAARVAAFINLVPVFQNSYIAPLIARAGGSGRPEDVSRIAVPAARRALLVAAGVGLLLAVTPWGVELAFGQEYSASVPAMRLLVAGAVVAIAFGPVNPVMLTCDREGIAMYLNAALLVATVIGVWFGVVRGGTTGAAVVSASTIVAYAAVASLALSRLDGVRTAAWSRP